ncbi:TonB-dependent receptor [Steroidobacter agaridevorans]|uniref:TonB-dependent receptor n=1 Tax=Steroidobacter agaridevorans TaxID=2695856 RepID=A0A829YGV0_9GAMM|nr:TonB-dependent receptor [Steroidobacter agaridevorans]GFE82547.1 TonB-dependent receptor [Steroidobacter agaridevorans]
MSDFLNLSRGMTIGVSTSALALLMSATNVGAAEGAAGVIDEIVVTAQKRSESVQDVPVSVSAFAEEQLTRVHATQLQDYAAYMPGINIANGGSPGQTSITLRGIAPVGPGSVVGTYIDETPLGASNNYARATTFALDLMPYDIERVEVLRGPQGTLYGAGSMGGLLKYVLKEPSTDALEFRAGVEGSDVSGADDLGWAARAGVNVPLGDSVALRASYFQQNTPGYIDNVYTGKEDANELEQSGGRVSLLWRINDAASLKVNALWQQLDSDNNGTMALSLVDTDPFRGTASFGDLGTSIPNEEPFSKDVDYYSATLNWNLGWADFVSATSYSKTHTSQTQDASITYGSLFPILSLLFELPGAPFDEGLSKFNISLDHEKWTQEFRLASTGEGAIQWRIGAFYTDEESENTQVVDATDINGVPIEGFLPYFAFAQLPSQYQELAVFGDVTFKINDSFDVITGLRYAQNDQKFRQISSGAIIVTANDPGESDEDVVTYAVSPRWHVTDDTMLYARVATGYRPGGPNTIVPGMPPAVEADELTNYELGWKSIFMDGRALLNAAVFYIDWKDIQQARTFGGVTGLDNAGDAESQGIEVESLFSVAEGLQLGFNFSYTDATLKSTPPDLPNALDVQLPGVPEWSGAITANYAFTAFGGREANVGGGWRYVDERYSQVVTTVDNLAYALPAYDVLDLNADVQFDSVTVRLFVKNLTDERAFTGGGVTTDGLNQPVRLDVAVLQPRTVGLSVDFQF